MTMKLSLFEVQNEKSFSSRIFSVSWRLATRIRIFYEDEMSHLILRLYFGWEESWRVDKEGETCNIVAGIQIIL